MPEIRLRRFDHSDFSRLIGWMESPEALMQWSGVFTWPLDERQLQDYLSASLGENPIRRIYTVLEAGRGEPVGHIELNNIDERNRSATVSRVLVGDPKLRGQGLGRAMVEATLRIGFGEMGLHRIDLVVFDFNAPAIACYERAGFVVEGRERDVRRMGGGYWSALRMGILEDQWRRHQEPPGPDLNAGAAP
jgi:RimJ/RimL family protein N-acetyltransferase